MIRVVVFAGAVVLMAIGAIALNTNANSRQKVASTGENYRAVKVQPVTGYDNPAVSEIRVCD